MHPYHKEGLQWAQELAECSDEELVARHNQSVSVRCYGLARQTYLGYLERELLARDFDSSVLFERDDGEKVTAYRLSSLVVISETGGRRLLVGGDCLWAAIACGRRLLVGLPGVGEACGSEKLPEDDGFGCVAGGS